MSARRWMALAVLAFALAAPVAAHEIGTTQVTARIEPAGVGRGRVYRIDVVTDAAALLEKVDAASGWRERGRSAEAVRSRLVARGDLFLSRVSVMFGNTAVRPTVDVTVTPARDEFASPVATIHLGGEVPPGAAHLVWRYGWTFASYPFRMVAGGAGAEAVTQWLEGGASSAPQALGVGTPPASRAAVARQYLWLGLTHIVPKGFDHVLLVLGLFLLTSRWRSVLWQVSAFTVAHSITLGLGIYGVIGTPPSVVEPLIALSIAYVAIENLVRSELRPWRVALVFAFGLLHGMGFAGVLTELGLPRGEFATALVTFNVGVEAGQLLVIGSAFALVGWYPSYPAYRQRVVLPVSLAIACVAIYWAIQRAAALG